MRRTRACTKRYKTISKTLTLVASASNLRKKKVFYGSFARKPNQCTIELMRGGWVSLHTSNGNKGAKINCYKAYSCYICDCLSWMCLIRCLLGLITHSSTEISNNNKKNSPLRVPKSIITNCWTSVAGAQALGSRNQDDVH